MSLKEKNIEPQIEEREFTEEETQNQTRLVEEDCIRGLLEAADFADETKRIEIARKGKILFIFEIHGLSEEEYTKCRTKNTKYVKNKSLGVKMPEDVNTSKYRCQLIYQATVEKDRQLLWDNKKIWKALENKGCQIMNGLDVIECSLMAGEKDKVIAYIDELSGYDDDMEEVAKN